MVVEVTAIYSKAFDGAVGGCSVIMGDNVWVPSGATRYCSGLRDRNCSFMVSASLAGKIP